MKNTNKIYTILSVFGVISLFLILFFIYPLLQEIKKNSDDLTLAKNSMVTLSAQTSETENFQKNYQTYKPNLDKISQLFVDPNNPVDFIEFLEGAAASSGVSSQISLPPSSPGVQQFINLQFISKGSFSGVSNFTKAIEAGPYLIELENLTIQNSDEPASGHTSAVKDYSSRAVDATFTIKVFTGK